MSDKSVARLVYVVTDSVSVRLLRGQLGYFKKKNFDVKVISDPGPTLDEVAKQDGVEAYGVPMVRKISMARDLRSLWQLFQLFRKWRPDIVNAGTPKAALLAMFVAHWMRIPVRIYTLHGPRYDTEKGILRFVLRSVEKFTASRATTIIAVSESLREKYLKEGFCSAEKITVLGSGSSNGVSLSTVSPKEIRALRKDFGWLSTTPVIGYVGRLNKDKGVVDLLEVFRSLKFIIPQVQLLIVGPVEDEAGQLLVDFAANREDAHYIDWVEDPTPYFALIKVFAFPSYREGLGLAVVEAALSGVPTVGYETTGVVDTIVDGETGKLVPLGDREQLLNALHDYLVHPTKRDRHGQAAKKRAKKNFSQQTVLKSLESEYQMAFAGDLNVKKTKEDNLKKSA